MAFISRDTHGAWYFPNIDAMSNEPWTPPLVAKPSHKLPVGTLHSIGASLLSRPSVDALHDKGIRHAPLEHLAPSLERKLSQRPSASEVADLGILKSSVQSTGERLRRISIGGIIEGALSSSKRATVDDLHAKGIRQKPLEDARTTLEQRLSHRPSAEELVSSGLLKSHVTAAREQLARRSLSDSLQVALEKRMSFDDMRGRLTTI